MKLFWNNFDIYNNKCRLELVGKLVILTSELISFVKCHAVFWIETMSLVLKSRWKLLQKSQDFAKILFTGSFCENLDEVRQAGRILHACKSGKFYIYLALIT